MSVLYNGAALSGVRVLFCRVEPVATIITDRTMGGAWLTQQIGTAARLARTQLVVTGKAMLEQLQSIYASGGSLTVQWDDVAHVGVMPDLPASELIRRGASEWRKYRVDMVLNLSEEAPL